MSRCSVPPEALPGASPSQCLPSKLEKVSPNKGGDLPEVAFEDREGMRLTSPTGFAANGAMPIPDPVPISLHDEILADLFVHGQYLQGIESSAELPCPPPAPVKQGCVLRSPLSLCW